MLIIDSVEKMKEWTKQARLAGRSIGLVPTMGALHDGHLTLVRTAGQQCDAVVISIFVNPTQFGPNEDYEKYPRDLSGDSARAAVAGAEVIFAPTAAEMYPSGYNTYINVLGVSEKLCGLSRPGHFCGVATVVAKLLNIVQPHRAFFGQKDAQQVLVLQRMVTDLNMNTELEIVPIVREADGLAMSSRNAYLSPAERQAALVLWRSLQQAIGLTAAGERSVACLEEAVRRVIEAEPLAGVDYVQIYQYPDLAEISTIQEKALLALAVRIGQTRLIDNIILEVK